MEKNIVIRKAVKADIPMLIQMRLDSFKKDQGKDLAYQYIELIKNTEAFFYQNFGHNLDVFVAELNGSVIAVFSTSYLTLLPRLKSKSSTSGYLSFTYIIPPYETEELKQAFYKESMINAREQGAGVFEISVDPSDLMRYREFGFRESGYPPVQLMLTEKKDWETWSLNLNKEITLKKAGKKDISVLIDMRLKYLCEMYGVTSFDAYTDFETRLKGFLEEHLGHDLDGFLAVRDGEILSACLTLYFDRMPEPGLETGKVGIPINSYTKPPYRNQGLAGALFGISAIEAEKRGVGMLEMEIPKERMHFYEKFGFEPMKVIATQIEL